MPDAVTRLREIGVEPRGPPFPRHPLFRRRGHGRRRLPAPPAASASDGRSCTRPSMRGPRRPGGPPLGRQGRRARAGGGRDRKRHLRGVAGSSAPTGCTPTSVGGPGWRRARDPAASGSGVTSAASPGATSWRSTGADQRVRGLRGLRHAGRARTRWGSRSSGRGQGGLRRACSRGLPRLRERLAGAELRSRERGAGPAPPAGAGGPTRARRAGRRRRRLPRRDHRGGAGRRPARVDGAGRSDGGRSRPLCPATAGSTASRIG